MNTQERINFALKRIDELNLLILHWRTKDHNTIKEDLSGVDKQSTSNTQSRMESNET